MMISKRIKRDGATNHTRFKYLCVDSLAFLYSLLPPFSLLGLLNIKNKYQRRNLRVQGQLMG